MNKRQLEAVQKLREAEREFLLSFGWEKHSEDEWESPEWYRKRTSITGKWDDKIKDWVPLWNQDLYKMGHAVNSLKGHKNDCPDE